MKIQELAIIFIIIILPISLLLSEYTQFQIKTINLQTEYDAKLTTATYDAIRAFQLNSKNSTTSDLANSKLRDIEASVKAFRNSIMSGFSLNGYTEEALNNYIPALVYTLYDGFYIYSPYNNINYQYEEKKDSSGNTVKDANGNIIYDEAKPIQDNGENLYGLKPYISYSCRYVKEPSVDVVITYSLDNYITVQGMVKDEYVNRGGYLIDGITVSGSTVKYNDVTIETEQLKENFGGETYKYIKKDGTKYYFIEDKQQIVYILNGTMITQCSQGDEEYERWVALINTNTYAQQYYREAQEFTSWFKSKNLDDLQYLHAIDEVISDKGKPIITNVWAGDTTPIFDFNSGTNASDNIENKLSNFNQHRLAVIRHKIETNLAIAISNYNSYSGATDNVFQMPKLKENEWDHITNNISLISFLQGLPIGGKIYNGYTLVTNSESEEVVLEESIYILGNDGNYHRIGDNNLVVDDSGTYGDKKSAGRLNLDFEKSLIIDGDNAKTYYPLDAYNASYDSIVMQNDVTTYDDIYQYVNEQKEDGNIALAQAFYTALGRERGGKHTDIDATRIYTITYHANGGNNAPNPQQQFEGESITITDEKPTNATEYTFDGWNTKQDGTGDDYKPEDTYTIDSDITLFAVWKKTEYKIDYAKEDIFDNSTGDFSTQTKTHGDKLTLHPSPDRGEGYTFKGWKSIFGELYGSEDEYTKNINDTLTATWERKSYTITYNLDGGSVEGNPTTYTIETENITLNKPNKGHYKFLGWTGSNGTTPQIEVTIPKGTTGNKQYTANWKSLVTEYKVEHYKQNIDGTYPTTPTLTETLNADAGTSVTPNVKTYTGFTAPSTETKIVAEDGSTVIKYYYTRNSYTVTITKGTGIQSVTGSGTYKYEQQVTLESTLKDGYKNVKWSGDYTTNKFKMPAKNVSITATATQEQYTITYNANGGSGAPSSQTKDHGEDLTLSSKKPTRNGYTFKGWSTTATGTVEYSPGGKYTKNSGVTLYAVWQKVSVTSVSINQTTAQWIPKTKYGSVNNYTTLTVTVSPSGALNKGVTWSSSNTNVATVDENGKVIAKAAGKITITATSNDNSSAFDTIEVYVYNAVYDWDTPRTLYNRDAIEVSDKFPVGTDYLILDNTYNLESGNFSYYCIRYSKNNSKFNIKYNSSGQIISKYYFRTNYLNGGNLCKPYFKVIEDGVDIDMRRCFIMNKKTIVFVVISAIIIILSIALIKLLKEDDISKKDYMNKVNTTFEQREIWNSFLKRNPYLSEMNIDEYGLNGIAYVKAAISSEDVETEYITTEEIDEKPELSVGDGYKKSIKNINEYVKKTFNIDNIAYNFIDTYVEGEEYLLISEDYVYFTKIDLPEKEYILVSLDTQENNFTAQIYEYETNDNNKTEITQMLERGEINNNIEVSKKYTITGIINDEEICILGKTEK